jgi:hypothetical protein
MVFCFSSSTSGSQEQKVVLGNLPKLDDLPAGVVMLKKVKRRQKAGQGARAKKFFFLEKKQQNPKIFDFRESF